MSAGWRPSRRRRARGVELRRRRDRAIDARRCALVVDLRRRGHGTTDTSGRASAADLRGRRHGRVDVRRCARRVGRNTRRFVDACWRARWADGWLRRGSIDTRGRAWRARLRRRAHGTVAGRVLLIERSARRRIDACGRHARTWNRSGWRLLHARRRTRRARGGGCTRTGGAVDFVGGELGGDGAGVDADGCGVGLAGSRVGVGGSASSRAIAAATLPVSARATSAASSWKQSGLQQARARQRALRCRRASEQRLGYRRHSQRRRPRGAARRW